MVIRMMSSKLMFKISLLSKNEYIFVNKKKKKVQIMKRKKQDNTELNTSLKRSCYLLQQVAE